MLKLLKITHNEIGGVTNYIVSVSCVVGMYRLKGYKFTRNLVPLPPISAGDFVTDVSEKTVDIMWEPPKKDFSRYSLTVEHLEDEKHGYTFGFILFFISLILFI